MTNILKIKFIPGYVLKSIDLENIQDILRTQIARTNIQMVGNVYISSFNETQNEVYIEKSVINYLDYIVEVPEQRLIFDKNKFVNKELFIKLYEILNSDIEPSVVSIKYDIVLESNNYNRYDNYISIQENVNKPNAVNFITYEPDKIKLIKPFKIDLRVFSEEYENIFIRDGIILYKNKKYFPSLNYDDYDFFVSKIHDDYIYSEDDKICQSIYLTYDELSDEFKIDIIKKNEYLDLNKSLLIELETFKIPLRGGDLNYFINNLSNLYKVEFTTSLNDIKEHFQLEDNFRYINSGFYVDSLSDYKIITVAGIALITKKTRFFHYLTHDVQIKENTTLFNLNRHAEINYLHSKPFDLIKEKIQFENIYDNDIKIFEYDEQNPGHIELATPIKLDTIKDMSFLNEGDDVLFINYNRNNVVQYDIIETPNRDLRVTQGFIHNGNTNNIIAYIKSTLKENFDYLNGLICGRIKDISSSTYSLQSLKRYDTLDTYSGSFDATFGGYNFKTIYPDFNIVINKNIENIDNIGFDKIYSLYFKFSTGLNIIEYFQSYLNITKSGEDKLITNNKLTFEQINNHKSHATNHYSDNLIFCKKLIDFKDDLTYNLLINFNFDLLNSITEFFIPQNDNAYSIRNFNTLNSEDSIYNVENDNYTLKTPYSNEVYIYPEMHRIGNVYVNNEQITENFTNNFPYKKTYFNNIDKNINIWLMGVATYSTGKVYGLFKINKDAFLSFSYLESKPEGINNLINENIPSNFIEQVILYDQQSTGLMSDDMARSILHGEIISGSMSDSFFYYLYKKNNIDDQMYITIKSDDDNLIGQPLYTLEFSFNINNVFINYFQILNYFFNKTLNYKREIIALETSSENIQDLKFDGFLNQRGCITRIPETLNVLEDENTHFDMYEVYDKTIIGKNKTVNKDELKVLTNFPFMQLFKEETKSNINSYNISYVISRCKDLKDLYYTFNGYNDGTNIFAYKNKFRKKAVNTLLQMNHINYYDSKIVDYGSYTGEYYSGVRGITDQFYFKINRDGVIKQIYLKINNSEFNKVNVDSLLFYDIYNINGDCIYSNVVELKTLKDKIIKLFIHDHIDFYKTEKYVLRLKTFKCNLSFNLLESYVDFVEYSDINYNYLLEASNQQQIIDFDKAYIKGYNYQNSLLKGNNKVYKLNDENKNLYIDYSGYSNKYSPVLNMYYTQSILKYIDTPLYGVEKSRIYKTVSTDFTDTNYTNFDIFIEFVQDAAFLDTLSAGGYQFTWKMFFYNDQDTVENDLKYYYNPKSIINGDIVFISIGEFERTADLGIYQYPNSNVNMYRLQLKDWYTKFIEGSTNNYSVDSFIIPPEVDYSVNKVTLELEFEILDDILEDQLNTNTPYINHIDIKFYT